MRHRPTFFEQRFAEKLSRWRIRYLSQYIIGNFIVDFYLPDHRTVVEIDGKAHYEEHNARRDARRSNYITNRDFKVIRIPNPEVLSLKKDDFIAMIYPSMNPEPIDRTFNNKYLASL